MALEVLITLGYTCDNCGIMAQETTKRSDKTMWPLPQGWMKVYRQVTAPQGNYVDAIFYGCCQTCADAVVGAINRGSIKATWER